ncbi:retroelement silencing factor 1 [Phyllobates terribilis]|uniref:retroelement silencing factor 1 n=1 Tax=Phyllobates terribilis TaxID=111132 RepID=UPI003CCABAB7
MSINRMDWSRNSNGAVAHPNNQQYLQQSTSSTASTMPSQTAYLPPNFCPPAQSHNFLKSLLGAKSSEEILQIQQSVLPARQKSTTPVQQTTQVSSSGQYNTSYSLLHMMTSATNQQSSGYTQNPVSQNLQVQAYPVAFLQTGVHQQAQPVPGVHQQAQPVPGVHQQAQQVPYYGANGLNSREVQQPLQGTQSREYTHTRPSQHMVYTCLTKKPSQNTPKNYQPIMPNANSQTSYSVQNGNSTTFVAPYRTTKDKNVPVLPPSFQNGQNIQMGSNFQTVPFTNALQSQGSMNDYVQNSQGQIMPNFSSGFANSSSNVLPSTTRQMSCSYTQSNMNASNVNVSQAFSKLNQNFGEQNVQQSCTAMQDQHSVAMPPPVHGGIVPQDQRHNNMQDILALLKIYQNIKHKYLLLNQENNLLRQKMQLSSQDNSGRSTMKPPLISSLPDETVPTNNPMGAQEVSQNSATQNQSSATHDVQTPTLYDNSLNVAVHNITHPSNSFSSYVNPTNNADGLSQKNYTGFENCQINIGTNSSGQAVGSETLRGQDPQKNSTGSIQANNQYLCSGNLNRSISQAGPTSSVQNVAQTTTASSKSCNPVQTTNKRDLYAKILLTSSSRDAIKASLPLWKSVPSETEPKQHVVNSSNDSLHRLEEMAAGVTLTQKSEHSGSNTSKGIEPQIAIVPPLVQIKKLVNTNQCPKVIPRSEDVANNEVNGLKENDCVSNIMLAFESAKSNLDNIQPRSNMVSSSPCSVEVSSSLNVDQNATKNIEMVDDGLQISGICTLVEGNSFYDSSIAMMFEGSLQTQSGSPLVRTEAKENHCMEGILEDTNIGNVSQANTLSPTTEMIPNKPDLQGEFEHSVKVKDDQGANVCLEIQPGQDLTAADMFGLDSNTGSDQLSELLTEFPFGIKNYMSENNECTEESLQKTTKKKEFPKSSVPFSCDIESDGSNEESQTKYSMDTSTNEDTKVEYRMDGSTNEESKTEEIVDMLINQKSETEYSMDTSTKEMEPQKTDVKVKTEPTPALPIDEGTTVHLEDDSFEICESSDSNIHITLLSKDQITELFPEEESARPIVHGEESPVDHFERKFEAPVVDVAESAIKEVPDYATTPSPETKLYCCVLGWASHTIKNAPKCLCKPIEMEEFEGLDLYENAEKRNTSPLAVVAEPTTAGFEPSTDYCKIKSEEIKNYAILPPVNKCPNLEPVKVSSEGKSSPQEKNKSELEFSEKHHKENLSLKVLKQHDFSANQKILQPRSYLDDHNNKKVKNLFSGSKSKVDGPQKLEKLIIKTDFLKNKHLLKMKRKYVEKTTSRVEESGARSVQKTNTEVGESAKTVIIDKIFGTKAKNEKSKSSAITPQQSGRSTSKRESFCSSDKLHSHNQGLAIGKHKERSKSRTESHFEKVKKVPTVQEYLERKRELCNKRSGSKLDQRDEWAEIRYKFVEKPSMEKSENNSPPELLRPLSPVKINVKTRNLESEAICQAQKGQPKTSGAYESLHKKHRGPSGSHEKGSLMKKRRDQKICSGKEKIYLTPCDGTRRNSCEGISLTKLQIRCSPEKPGYFERRKSLDSYVHNKLSKSDTKNGDAPKMLEFKLCPEFVNRSPTTQEKKGEPKETKERSVVEGIKSKKEAWYIDVPFKKRKINICSEDQGHQSPPQSTSSVKSTQNHASRPVQDSQTTFNVFKQMYHEQRSKSLDGSL